MSSEAWAFAASVLVMALMVGGREAIADDQADAALASRLLDEGNEFLRLGNYFQASERFASAVKANPWSGRTRLAFGHAHFALGNYGYAAFELRRGIRYLGFPDDLELDLATVFSSRSAVERGIADCRKYLGYYPKDDRAWTVLAYVAFFVGDDEGAIEACRELAARTSNDSFAAYFMQRVEQRRNAVVVEREEQTPPEPPARRVVARVAPEPHPVVELPSPIEGFVPLRELARNGLVARRAELQPKLSSETPEGALIPIATAKPRGTGE